MTVVMGHVSEVAHYLHDVMMSASAPMEVMNSAVRVSEFKLY